MNPLTEYFSKKIEEIAGRAEEEDLLCDQIEAEGNHELAHELRERFKKARDTITESMHKIVDVEVAADEGMARIDAQIHEMESQL